MYLKDNTLLQGGKYKIVRFLSSGGFGNTYEAELCMIHKRVAIKEFFVKNFCNRDSETSQVSVSTSSNQQLVNKLKQKFIDEAASIWQFNHPNIVRVTDVFEENGTAYYVMDYINGISLHSMLKRDGALYEEKAIRYIKQVADALITPKDSVLLMTGDDELSPLPSSISQTVRNAVEKAMLPQRKKRTQTIIEFINEISMVNPLQP